MKAFCLRQLLVLCGDVSSRWSLEDFGSFWSFLLTLSLHYQPVNPQMWVKILRQLHQIALKCDCWMKRVISNLVDQRRCFKHVGVRKVWAEKHFLPAIKWITALDTKSNKLTWNKLVWSGAAVKRKRLFMVWCVNTQTWTNCSFDFADVSAKGWKFIYFF